LIQSDGRIVVAGFGGVLDSPSFRLVRLRSDGALDETFGSGGKRTLEFGGDQESAFGAALQPDGRILVAGDSDFRVAVARLNPGGSRDTSFSGDGKKIFGWGSISRAQAVLVLPSGKIMLAGFSGPEGGNLQAARLNPKGALDATFGTGGKVGVDFGGDDFGLAIARQADGRILVAGGSTAVGAVVVRLRTNGALDPDFDGDGRVTLAGVPGGSARAVLVQPDGKIVVAGNANGSDMMTVTRLLPNGSLDTSFDGDGTATIDFPGSVSDRAEAAVLQPDGKIVVAGSTSGTGAIAVVRLNPNGAPDTTFGTGGKATAHFSAAAFGNAVALQPNGRIVVVGQRSGGDDFAVARLLG
jgi:uncharacterized delta-60 repeat protein